MFGVVGWFGSVVGGFLLCGRVSDMWFISVFCVIVLCWYGIVLGSVVLV